MLLLLLLLLLLLFRINTTREMCTALKNHCVKIDASLAQGQEDRDHLIRVNQERMMEHQVSFFYLIVYRLPLN